MTGHEVEASTPGVVVDLEGGYVLIPVSVEFLPLFVDRWMVCRRVRLSARSDGIYDLELEGVAA